MSGAPLPKEELDRLFEAARWAPSSGNMQPWRMVVARREQPAFAAFFDLLAGFNRVWCHRAAALVVVCGQTRRVAHDGSERAARLYAFDTGAAWMSLALQGTQQGLVVHGMEGFDHVKARDVVKAPEGVDVLCMVAIGLPGDPAQLPEDKQKGEAQNGRDPIEQHVFDSSF
jgi:nitroreductase